MNHSRRRTVVRSLLAGAGVQFTDHEGPGYTRSAAQFKGLLPGDDMVLAASSPAELALQTLVITGNLGAGFTGRAALGIRA